MLSDCSPHFNYGCTAVIKHNPLILFFFLETVNYNNSSLREFEFCELLELRITYINILGPKNYILADRELLKLQWQKKQFRELIEPRYEKAITVYTNEDPIHYKQNLS